jgi:hypothetical protein
MVIKQVGNQLNVPIKIQSFDASFLTHFPYFSLTLNDLIIPEYPKKLNKNLVLAEHFDVLFNPFDLINQDYTIKKVAIRNGEVNLTDENYNIFKSNSNETNQQKTLVNFSSIELKNVQFNYFEVNGNRLVQLGVNKLESRIDIEGDVVSYSVNTSTTIRMDQLSEYPFMATEPVRIKGDGSVNLNKLNLSLNKTTVQVLGEKLKVQGSIDWLREVHYDIAINGNDFDAQKIIQLSPQVDWKSIGNPKFSKAIDLNVKVSDLSNKPQLNIKATSKSLGILIGEIEEKVNVNGVNFELDWNSKGSLVSFELRQMDYDNHISKVFFEFNDNTKPKFSLNVEKSVPLGLIKHFVPEADLTGHVETEGILLDMIEDDHGRYVIQDLAANIDLEGVAIGEGEESITFNKGKLMSSGVNMDGVRVEVTVGEKEPFTVSGNVELSNINYLLYEGIKAKLKGDAKVKYYSMKGPSQNTNESDSSRDYLQDLTVHLQLQLDSCSLDKIKINESQSLVQYEAGLLAITGLNLEAFGGNLKGNFNRNTKGNQTELKGQAQFSNIDMNRLFYELNDFDQSELTHENIFGTSKGDVTFSAFWLNDSFTSEKLNAVCNITIDQGKLVNYETLIELSEFVNVDELSNVEFKTLKNTITIDSGNIYIPKMSVFNTALSMDVSGVHRLDNFCNYQVEISVVEVLAKRAGWARKRKEKRYNEEQNGGLTAYISMVGHVDDLQISYDKKRLKKKIKSDLKQEKQEFSDALKGNKKEEEILWDE